MGFKKKPEASLSFIKKTRNPTWIRPDYHEITKKAHIYIYIYIAINTNPNSLIFQLMTPASSPSLPHFSSHLLSPHPRPSLPHTAHGLTPHAVTLSLTLLSPTRMVVAPLTDSLSPTLTASLSLSKHNQLHQILQIPVDVSPCWLSVRLICVNQNNDVFLRRSMQPSLSCTHRRGTYVARRHQCWYQI